MKTLTQQFAEKYLSDVQWPKKFEAINFSWNVSGILKNRSNEHLKFDTRPMNKVEHNRRMEKRINPKSQADKVVLSYPNYFLIIDSKEFYLFMKTNKIQGVSIEELEKKLEWNIKLEK